MMIWMKINITTVTIMKNSNFSLLYVLYPKASIEKVKAQARDLLKVKRIACANILPPFTSMYLWKTEEGKEEICSDEEIIVFFKTISSKVEEVKKNLISSHDYDIPCIVDLNADVNDEYLKYLNQYLVGEK